MSYRPERERQGYCRVIEYDQLAQALRSGLDWYEAKDLYGDQLLIRLSEVHSLGDASPAAIVAADVEEDERKAHERAHGAD